MLSPIMQAVAGFHRKSKAGLNLEGSSNCFVTNVVRGYIGYKMGLYGSNGKYHGNYYLEFRV